MYYMCGPLGHVQTIMYYMWPTWPCTNNHVLHVWPTWRCANNHVLHVWPIWPCTNNHVLHVWVYTVRLFWIPSLCFTRWESSQEYWRSCPELPVVSASLPWLTSSSRLWSADGCPQSVNVHHGIIQLHNLECSSTIIKLFHLTKWTDGTSNDNTSPAKWNADMDPQEWSTVLSHIFVVLFYFNIYKSWHFLIVYYYRALIQHTNLKLVWSCL